MKFIKPSLTFSLTVLLICFASTLSAKQSEQMVFPFIKNVGQINEQVSFYSTTPKADVFINKSGETIYKFKGKDSSFVIKETLVKGKPQLKPEFKTKSKINYLKGKKSYIDVPNYKRVNFGNVWKGVNMYVESRPGNVEKIFEVAPGAKSDLIQLKIEGSQSLSANAKGELVIYTSGNENFSFTKPIAWQNTASGKKSVEVKYTIDGLNYGFELGEYDKSLSVLIDPLLASTYVGGNGLDSVKGMRLDESNHVILAGFTQSTNFPITTGLISDTIGGTTDLFAIKLSPDFCHILSATYIGGSDYEQTIDVDFDSSGNLYFVGRSDSTDFPLPNFPYTPFQAESDANGTMHLFKLSADFTSILGVTYIGGDVVDQPRGIEIADSGNVYVFGFTNSTNYPYTVGAFENSGKGSVISVFNSDLSQLLHSTRIGGGSIYDIAFDEDGSVFAIGSKISTQPYTTTPGVYMETPPGGLEGDNYIAHLSADLSTLNAATFIGSNSIEYPYDIELHGNEIVVAVYVKSGFPMTADPFDNEVFFGGGSAVFKMSKDLTTLNHSTHLDVLPESSMIVEDNGDVIVFGATHSLTFPGGKNPVDPTEGLYNGGQTDFGLIRLSSTLSEAKNASYIGGYHNELSVIDVLKDRQGNLIIAGETSSNDIETTQFAVDRTFNGQSDIILQKISSSFSQQQMFSDAIFCDGFDNPDACSCN